MTATAGPAETAIAFIGLGNMGLRIASHVSQAFANTLSYDREPSRAAAASAAGVPVAKSASELADRQFDIVLVSVNTPHALTEVLTGQDSFLRQQRGGTIVLDIGTTGATRSRELADSLKSFGHRFIDAPISGGINGAARGDLTAMVGSAGGDAVVDRVLRSFCARVHYMGDIGLGAVAKLANNAVAIGTLGLLGEALAYAENAGLDRGKALEVMTSSSGDSRILRSKQQLIEHAEYGEPQFEIQVALKDIRLLLDEVRDDAPSELPLLTAVSELVGFAALQCDKPADISVIADPKTRRAVGPIS
ncbi:hypothetical protein A5674_22935 [Mycobacterium malmoense]|uniref:NAD(P)-dependent oxidoreductase n=1 Tax=Mycobacterium malmoense TaxID=1780 RepID=UPI00080B97AD|nr:NAD(P)-dependent oxidoreductase [Mycobacterium malmoense]OCB24404.1 hypothetical protein A5674_22935 [Mycobacterium malmoense]